MAKALILAAAITVSSASAIPLRDWPMHGAAPCNLNIVIKGQSNAALFIQYGGAERLKSHLRRLLGLWGPQTITLLGGQLATIWSGVGVVGNPGDSEGWLSRDAAGAWQDGPRERRFIGYLRSLPEAVRSWPTLTLWLHNENDSINPRLDQATWESAIRHNVEEERQALGQKAATTPVDFVYVPSDCPTGCLEMSGQSASVQILKAGYEHLASDPVFNARIGAQMGDVDMDGVNDGTPGFAYGDAAGSGFGGLHFDRRDAMLMADRLALQIANRFHDLAQTGSPEARAERGLPEIGPRAFRAVRQDEKSVWIAFALEGGSAGLQPLSVAAAQGAGWSVVDGRHIVYGKAARIEDNRILVAFDQKLPDSDGARLHYGWGSGRITLEHAPQPLARRQPGRGTAIYDDHGLPLFTPAEGLRLPPAI